MLLQFNIDAILQYAEKHVMLKNQLRSNGSHAQMCFQLVPIISW